MEFPPTNQEAIQRLRIWYVVSLGSGFVAILLGWALEGVVGYGIPFIFTFLFPLLTMVVYIVQGLRIDEANKVIDPFADSVYYMGFLFTLVALVVSLFSLDSESSGTSGLVQRFAVALTTTVVGLATRTYLANFKSTAQDQIQKLEFELERSASRLRNQFYQLSTSMEMQGLAYKASQGQLIKDLDKTAKELAKAAERMQSTGTSLSAGLEQKLNEHAEKLDIAAEMVVKSLASTSGSVKKQTDNSVEELESSFKVMSTTLKSAADEWKNMVAKVDLPSDLLVKQLQRPINALVENINALAEKIKQQEANTQSMKQMNEAVKSSIDETTASFQILGERITAISLDTSLQTLSDRVNNVAGDVTTLAEKIAAFEKIINDHLSNVEILSRLVEDDVKILRKHRAEIEAHLASSREAVVKVHTELTSAVDMIREELAS